MMSDSTLLMLPALAIVLGLIWAAGRAVRAGWLRLPMRPDPVGRLAIVETLAIDSRRRLHLIRCNDRHALLLTGGTHDTLLGWSTPASNAE